MATTNSTETDAEERPDPLMHLLEQSLETECLTSGSSHLSPFLPWTSRPHTTILQVEGAILVQMEGESTQQIPVGSGLVLPEGTRFRIDYLPTSRGALLTHWGHFRFRVLGELDLFHFIQPSHDLGVKAGDRIRILNQQLRQTLDESTGPLIARVVQRRRLCTEMLSLIVSKSQPRPGAVESIAALARITPVLRFMREQMARPIFLREMAQIVGLSPDRFNVVFRSATRLTPLQYLTRLRMKQAQGLLLSTQRPVHEISQDVGFRDLPHFSRTFKRYSSVGPQSYRMGVKATMRNDR